MVGAKATNALSEYFKVTSIRDGKIAVALFNKGELVDYKEEDNPNQDGVTGTLIKFKPDSTIFKESIELDYNQLKKQIQELAYLSPGLTFKFKFKNKPVETIVSKNGIIDYINDLNKEKDLITSVFYAEKQEGRIGVKIAMAYNSTFTETYKLYTNSIPNSGGTHLTGFRTALTQAINEYARVHRILKDKDPNITGDELKEGLTLVLSFIMPDPVFSGQTKENLTSSEGRTLVQRLVSSEIKTWLDKNPKDAKKIIDKAVLARKAKEKARKAKEAVRNVETRGKKILNLPTKLVDAWSKDRRQCEFIITEGDSAASGLVGARNGEFQAIFPIRGKIISVYKSSDNKIFNNQEVINIIKALGLELNIKTSKLEYSAAKLRYGKIILCTDAE